MRVAKSHHPRHRDSCANRTSNNTPHRQCPLGPERSTTETYTQTYRRTDAQTHRRTDAQMHRRMLIDEAEGQHKAVGLQVLH